MKNYTDPEFFKIALLATKWIKNVPILFLQIWNVHNFA